MGDPVSAARHARSALAEGGTVMLVEPYAADRVEDNKGPIGRLYYSALTTLCCAHALSEGGQHVLGARPARPWRPMNAWPRPGSPTAAPRRGRSSTWKSRSPGRDGCRHHRAPVLRSASSRLGPYTHRASARDDASRSAGFETASPHGGSSLGRLAPRSAGWRLTKRGSGPATSEPLLRAFYPSLPEPRRQTHRPGPVGRGREGGDDHRARGVGCSPCVRVVAGRRDPPRPDAGAHGRPRRASPGRGRAGRPPLDLLVHQARLPDGARRMSRPPASCARPRPPTARAPRGPAPRCRPAGRRGAAGGAVAASGTRGPRATRPSRVARSRDGPAV